MNDSDRGDLQDRGQNSNMHGTDRHKRDQAPGLASNSSCVKLDMARCRHNAADHDLDAYHDKLGDDSQSESFHVKAKAEDCRDGATCIHVKAKPPSGDFTKVKYCFSLTLLSIMLIKLMHD